MPDVSFYSRFVIELSKFNKVGIFHIFLFTSC